MQHVGTATDDASGDQAGHACDCCPPGTCHSASAKCNTGQCGSCAISMVEAATAHTFSFLHGKISSPRLTVTAPGPESLYRPPRS